MYINVNKLVNNSTASQTTDNSNIIKKNGHLNLTGMGSIVKDSLGISNGPSLFIKPTNHTSTKKEHMPSLETIAHKIATGKEVSQEELDYLKENNYHLYLQAMQAASFRETLERKLKSAVSDTAKMQIISEALNMAMSFQSTAETSPGHELIADAIMEAIKDENENIRNETLEILDLQYKNSSFTTESEETSE